jgi:hypothetical protein
MNSEKAGKGKSAAGTEESRDGKRLGSVANDMIQRSSHRTMCSLDHAAGNLKAEVVLVIAEERAATDG